MEERLTKGECHERLRQIKEDLASHAGHKVLVILRDGRARTPIVATLQSLGGKTYAAYTDYGQDGMPRGRRQIYIHPALVHTGEITIDYCDDDV